MNKLYDVIIIGGGAAGLSAAQYAARANLSVLVIEEKNEGGQAILIDKLENYPGFFEPISGWDFSVNMKKQAEAFGAEFMYASVTGIGKKDELFLVPLEAMQGEEIKTLRSKTVILATGAEHRKLGIPGEEQYFGRGLSYCATCDGPFFKNKHIVVVGGGDSACDESSFLSHLTSTVTIIHRRDAFRAQKALAERTLNNPNINVRFDTIVKEVKGENGRVSSVLISNTKTGEEEDLTCDAVFIAIGLDPRTELASLAKKDEGGYIITDENMHTSIPGLFAAGDVRAKSFRQIVTAASDGAIAAHEAATCIDEMRCMLSPIN